MAIYFIFQLPLTLVIIPLIFLHVSSQQLWSPRTEELRQAGVLDVERQPTLLEVCLAIKDVWGYNRPSEFYFQLLCDVQISKKLRQLREQYPQIRDDNEIEGRSTYTFGGSHVNQGGYSNNPQTSSVQNLNMNKGGQAVSGSSYSPNVGYDYLAGRSTFTFGGSHTNDGGYSVNPQTSKVQNLNMNKRGQAVAGSVNSPNMGDDDLAGRSSFTFGGSHTNTGGYSKNQQTSSVQNLNMNKGGQAVAGSVNSPNMGDDDLAGRSSFTFGGSHTNTGGYSWNPQTSSVQNLNMNKGGKAVAGSVNSPNDGEGDLAGRSTFQFGGSHTNTGGYSLNQQTSSVQNLNLNKGGKAVAGSVNSPNDGEGDLAGRSSFTFGGSHTNTGGYSLNDQTSSVHNLNMNKGGKSVAGSVNSPNMD